MKKYSGIRTVDGRCVVTVSGNHATKLLHDARELWCHSHTGYEWGYPGSGPAQLALAMLYDATGSKALTLKFYQDFKRDWVANFPREAWTVQHEDIMAWLLLLVESRLDVVTEFDLPNEENGGSDDPFR